MVPAPRAVLLLLLLLSPSLLAQDAQFSITPNSGPAAGGQEVTIKGNFGSWPYGVIFGSVSVTAERIDEHTLKAVTPPHPAGTVPVTIFEYDIGISTGLTYTFTGEPAGALERILLPIFLPPINGAHGSQFRTDFRAQNLKTNESLLTYGLRSYCPIAPHCSDPVDLGLLLGHGQELHPLDVLPSGTPGAFVYTSKADAANLVLQLRAYDVSREATNFGTEIPVVHEHEMTSDPVTLLGVPTDSRFRNTLRIYATAATNVSLTIEGEGVKIERTLPLRPGVNAFDPAYAQFLDFPTNAGPVRVTVSIPPSIILAPMPPPPDIWAFVSVTNNETQHITVISPQR